MAAQETKYMPTEDEKDYPKKNIVMKRHEVRNTGMKIIKIINHEEGRILRDD